MMRAPDFEIDGWRLEDGEQYHRRAPSTFSIPDLEVRRILEPGDFAKLIFKIAVDDDEDPEAFERMWVIVRERVPSGYLGMLDNEPSAIAENGEFWRGSELPFEPKHIVAVEHADAESLALIGRAPPIPWSRVA